MKKVPTSRGLFAIVDDEDFELVIKWKWAALPVRDAPDLFYAVGLVNGKHMRMHRFLLGVPDGQEIDHANRNGLDNRRSNLRLCLRSENMANRRYPLSGTGLRGVREFHRLSGPYYRASVGAGMMRRFGPVRENPIAAAFDRDLEALREYGDFAVLNFPCIRKGVGK